MFKIPPESGSSFLNALRGVPPSFCPPLLGVSRALGLGSGGKKSSLIPSVGLLAPFASLFLASSFALLSPLQAVGSASSEAVRAPAAATQLSLRVTCPIAIQACILHPICCRLYCQNPKSNAHLCIAMSARHLLSNHIPACKCSSLSMTLGLYVRGRIRS